MNLERPIPVISQAVMQLFASRDDSKDWAKAIAMMRHGFGGHPFGPDQGVRQERRLGRIGDFWRDSGS
jgi:6-phosphogluconate dehydrogenase